MPLAWVAHTCRRTAPTAPRLGQRGFTIVGSVLAMTIVGIMGVGMMSAFQMVNRTALEQDMAVPASALAQERVDQVVSAKAYQGYNTITSANYPGENLTAPFAGFTRTTTIQEVNPADPTAVQVNSGLKRIDVTVAWGASTAQRVILTTMVSNF